MRESHSETVSFLSPVAAAAATLTPFVFSSVTRLTFLWTIPAHYFLPTPRESSPEASCWAGGAERCGARRCWDVWHASVGWSVSSPCRPPSSCFSCSAPSAFLSLPTSFMASSGSWSRREGVYLEPKVHLPTPMTQGSLLLDCYLCEVSQGGPG